MNLVDVAKSTLEGPVVERISAYLGETPGHTQQAINDAVPSVFQGMASQASSKEGAAKLYELAKESGQKEGGLLSKLGTSMAPQDAEALGQKGQSLLRSLFGDREPQVAEQVASHAGISRGAASKLLALVSPVAMAVLGREMLARGVGVAGLTGLLSGFKPAYAGVSTAGTHHTPEVFRPPTRATERHEWDASTTRTKVGWLPVALLALAALIGLMWAARGRHREANVENAPHAATVQQAQPTAGTLPPAERLGPGAEQLSSFLDDQNATLPKRFAFEGLNFGTDSTALSGAAPANLDAIASALKAHPTAQVRIEGNTDGSGDPTVNQKLSLARAEAVRDLLVQRGVPASQLSVAGNGSARPVAGNDNEDGRAANRRIELVVVRR
jgi:outer membrane protein OmpA-like peptidoglycan-associated protein